MRWIYLLLACVTALHAHEIGTTRVAVHFHEDRTYEIEVVTDATALLEKLQSSLGTSSAATSSALDPRSPALQPMLASFDQKFRQKVNVSFDGASVHPEIAYSVEPPIDALSAAAATIRLKGEIPAKARQLTWTYGWTFATYAMSVGGGTQWLDGSDTSSPISLDALPAPPKRLEIIQRYLKLGFTHIVPFGIDHMLFVLGIYLLSRNRRSVLWQVSAFTVAHSITLGLSMYGLVSVPSRIVEPMIALSIAYVAIENIFLSELHTWRIALVFAFGLLHGMGFAGALKELGLPHAEFLTALLTFNVGVEAGQLTVIAAAFLLVGWHCSQRNWYRQRVVVPASAMIACAAIYWTIQRLTV